MRNCDLRKLIFKKALCISWICTVFTLLFSTVMFVGFARNDMLTDLYKEMIRDIESTNIEMKCDYKSGTSHGDSQIDVYYSKPKETFDVDFIYGEKSLYVNSYERGINVCAVSSALNGYIEGNDIKVGGDGIWISKDFANNADIKIGDEIRISGDSEKIYRVAGRYSDNIKDYFNVFYIPFFIVASDNSCETASLVVASQDVYALYFSDMRESITDDQGAFVLCEGYHLTEVSFTLLFAMLVAVATLVLAKTINYFLKHFTRQTFLLSVFGLSKIKQSAIYVSVLLILEFASLIAAIGVFYILVAITDSLANSIMGMSYSDVSVVGVALYTLIGFVLITVVVTLKTIFKTTLEKGVA